MAAEPSASDLPGPAVCALRRLTYGYRPEHRAAFQALGGSFDERLEHWVNAQLTGCSAHRFNGGEHFRPAERPVLKIEYHAPGTVIADGFEDPKSCTE